MSAEACPRTDGKILFLAILVSAITAVTSTNEPIKRSKPAPQKRSNKAFFILDASFETQHDVSTADHLESHDSVDVNIEFGRYHRVVKRKRLHPNIRKRVNKTSRSLTMEDEKDKQEKSLRRTTSSSQKHKKTNLDIDVELLESFLKYKAGQQKYTNQQSFEITGSQVEMQTKNINHGVDGELLESLLKSEKELSGISYAYTGIPTAYPTIKVSVKTTKNVSTPSPTTLSISSQPTSAAPTTSDSTITITPTRVSDATSMPSTLISSPNLASTVSPTSFGDEFITSIPSNSPVLSGPAITIEPTTVSNMIMVPTYPPMSSASQTETTVAPSVGAEVFISVPTYSPTSHTYSPTSTTYYPTTRTYSPTYSTSSYSNETASDLTRVNPCPYSLSKRKTLQDDLTLSYDVILDNERQLFCSELEYDGLGWVGFGVSESGEMVGSTAVVGLPDSEIDSNPGLYSLDGKTNSLIKLLSEEEQTILGASILQENGVTVLKFATYIDDVNDDFVIKVPVTNFIYAAGESNDFGYHGMRRGSVSLVLSNSKKKKHPKVI
ncbi:hypothetical protein ACHAW6_011518 [Cyclotella cf. meneghiniana]